jgi:hypothetical protein
VIGKSVFKHNEKLGGVEMVIPEKKQPKTVYDDDFIEIITNPNPVSNIVEIKDKVAKEEISEAKIVLRENIHAIVQEKNVTTDDFIEIIPQNQPVSKEVEWKDNIVKEKENSEAMDKDIVPITQKKPVGEKNILLEIKENVKTLNFDSIQIIESKLSVLTFSFIRNQN